MVETNNWEEVKSGTGLWLPETEGEELIGEVTESIEGQYGIQLVLLKADGEKVTTPSHKALQSRLTNFKAGDMLKIVFKGTDLPKIKGQNGTRLYTVFASAPTNEESIATPVAEEPII